MLSLVPSVAEKMVNSIFSHIAITSIYYQMQETQCQWSVNNLHSQKTFSVVSFGDTWTGRDASHACRVAMFRLFLKKVTAP